jgi:hypothetical protein
MLSLIFFGRGDGNRTRHLLHGKQTCYRYTTPRECLFEDVGLSRSKGFHGVNTFVSNPSSLSGTQPASLIIS